MIRARVYLKMEPRILKGERERVLQMNVYNRGRDGLQIDR